VLKNLLEMNSDVAGEAVTEDPGRVVGSEPSFFKGFSLVIASQLPPDTLVSLAAVLWSMEIPLIVARSYGLIGLVRVCHPEHICFEAKGPDSKPDLRVANPFPALQAIADGLDLDACDDETHRHVPYPVLLVKLMEKFVAEKGARPGTFKQRKEFAAWIETQRRDVRTEDGAPVAEENFDEAVQEASLACLQTHASRDVAALLDDPRLDSLKPGDDAFWFLARALREFRAVEGAGVSLPVTTQLPDMTATTAQYLELSRAYKEQSETDRASFCAHLDRVRAEVMHGSVAPLADELIDRFLSNTRSMKVIRFRSIAQELGLEETPTPSSVQEAVEECEMLSPDALHSCPALWYVMLRACDEFFAEHGRFPGSDDASLASDAADVAARAEPLCAKFGVSGKVDSRFSDEMARYGACEPHAVAAVVGAVASQEAIKLITRQYVPVNNTYVFNGIVSKGEQIEV
jgi:NEDD8-activating enzyme E1 regulatory subunit